MFIYLIINFLLTITVAFFQYINIRNGVEVIFAIANNVCFMFDFTIFAYLANQITYKVNILGKQYNNI